MRRIDIKRVVCVCVCEREREREIKKVRKIIEIERY